jgi:cytidine deaminase
VAIPGARCRVVHDRARSAVLTRVWLAGIGRAGRPLPSIGAADNESTVMSKAVTATGELGLHRVIPCARCRTIHDGARSAVLTRIWLAGVGRAGRPLPSIGAADNESTVMSKATTATGELGLHRAIPCARCRTIHDGACSAVLTRVSRARIGRAGRPLPSIGAADNKSTVMSKVLTATGELGLHRAIPCARCRVVDNAASASVLARVSCARIGAGGPRRQRLPLIGCARPCHAPAHKLA